MIRFVFIALALSGCVINSTAHINYDEFGVYASDKVGNKEFEDVGPIGGSSSGFMSRSCEDVAKDALQNMLDVAKQHGANTVYNVRFFDDGHFNSIVPVCRNLWILYHRTVDVRGIAAKVVDGKDIPNGAIYIPKNANIPKIVASWIDVRDN